MSLPERASPPRSTFSAAIEADGGRPADDIAADYFRRRRYIGAKDRVQVAAYVYAVLRHRAVLDWWIARASKDEIAPDARSRIIAALLLIDKWPPEEVAASFDGGRFRPAALVSGRSAARARSGRPHADPSGDAARRRLRSAGLARTAISPRSMAAASKTRWRRSTPRPRSICASMR